MNLPLHIENGNLKNGVLLDGEISDISDLFCRMANLNKCKFIVRHVVIFDISKL